MNQDEYRACIINGYLDALCCLAMEFRSTPTDTGKLSKVVHTYNALLELLIAFGWSDGLDPDSELPDEWMSQEYIQMLRDRKPTYVPSKSHDTYDPKRTYVKGKMVTKTEARRLVEAKVSNWPLLAPGDEVVILDASTRETEFGWVFFYQSRMRLETGALRHALAGNAPLIVDRDTGEIVTTGTAHPIEHYIAEYENRRK